MTIKELAYSAQQYLQSCIGISFKRAHVYELLAASFGFNSYAALGVDSVFSELRQNERPLALHAALVTRRQTELGYASDNAHLVTAALQSFVAERRIGITSISSLVSGLRNEASPQRDDIEEENEDILDEDNEDIFGEADDSGSGPLLIDGLEAAARRHNALAHYALALIHAPDDEDDPDASNSYWYSQQQQGHVLTGAAKEWAEEHAAHLAQTEKYARHLREAVRLGRAADARYWLTLAAEGGDTDAMLQLIEEHDSADPLRCWTWVHLSRLVGTDLAQDAHYAIHEDGSEYDDDVGGPLYVAGRNGVDLDPLSAEQNADAMRAAQDLFKKIQ